MEKMRIGNSDVWAPKLTLGSFGMGGGTSWQDTTKDDQELIDFIRAAHEELGICGIDTAPVYGTGRSERVVRLLRMTEKITIFPPSAVFTGEMRMAVSNIAAMASPYILILVKNL